jgi:lipoprotein-anchoring transpeptidase ErfK/SrfK
VWSNVGKARWLLAATSSALALGCGHDPAPPAAATAAASASSASAADPAAEDGTTGIHDGDTPPSSLPDLPKLEGAPVVGLDGSSRPWPPPVPDNLPRLAAIAVETPILGEPDVFAPRLGQLRAGAIVEMDPRPVTGKGCAAGFRAIKPMGFVCLGSTTLDLNHPFVRASSRRPDVTQKLPYMYGMAVRGGPAYASLPTDDDLAKYEPHLKSHLRRWSKDPVNGARYGVELWGKWDAEAPPPALTALKEKRTDVDIPPFLMNGGRTPNLSGLANGDGAKAGEFSRHNGVAFVDTMLWEGRRYNVAVDLRLMPADRFRPIRGSDFHGVRIPEDVRFPFAFVKGKRAKRYVEESGHLVSSGTVPWRSTVQVTTRQRIAKGRTYDEVEGGAWIPDEDLAKVFIAQKMPGWANDGEKWLDVNVSKQVLMAYEGTTPVYATLVSTGEAGLADPKTTRSTARGIFRIHTKYITATMDSKVVGEEFELRDVPYVQYFHEGYALHAAYWHDVFGQPKSHGCINLAPEDARRIFFWTEPNVPAGWHGASKGKGTVVFVHQ